MKNQKGFTLIELLLVLAIIGIISAIAIPALLSQRGRARDKSAISNMTGRMGDLIGQYDRLKEQGLAQAAITGGLQTYLTDTSANDKNPWDSAAQAFLAANLVGKTSALATATDAKTAADTLGAGCGLGVVKFEVDYPAVGFQGFVIGAVGTKEIQGQSGGTYASKVSAIE